MPVGGCSGPGEHCSAAGGLGGGEGTKGSSCEGGGLERCLKSPLVTHSSDGKHQPMKAALFVVWKSKILVSVARDPGDKQEC